MATSSVDTNLNYISSIPFIVDTTLRDGEQSPGIVFSLKQKVTLLRRLADLGVREFEIGIPAMGGEKKKELETLRTEGEKCGVRMIYWSRCREEDIEECIRSKAAAIHIALPVSDLQMGILGLNRTELLDRINKGVALAKGNVDFISVGAQDATRADNTFLKWYIETAQQMGAGRIRIADTVGCADPLAVFAMMRRIKTDFPNIEVEFHAHNDFGMAAANAVAALRAGANGVSTTLLGIGERAGNAPLEIVAVAAQELLGCDMGIKEELLYPLCRYLSNIIDVPISEHHPIIGERVFTHESGIHTHGQIHHPKAFQPIVAEKVGRRQPGFVFGAHSGRTAVKHLIETRTNTHCSDTTVDAITKQIKILARNGHPLLSEQDVLDMLSPSLFHR